MSQKYIKFVTSKDKKMARHFEKKCPAINILIV